MSRKAHGDGQQGGGYIAEGRGICGFCQRVVEVGEKFFWQGSGPPQVECGGCREFRLGRKKERGK